MIQKLTAVIFLISFTTLCNSGSVSINQVDDIRIYVDGKTIYCDKIQCPKSTTRCVVTKKTLENDNSKIERWAKCFDKDNKILLDDKKVEPNPDPNTNVDIRVGHGTDGSYSFANNSQMKEIIDRTTNRVQQQIARMQQHLQKQIKDLENMFS